MSLTFIFSKLVGKMCSLPSLYAIPNPPDFGLSVFHNVMKSE